MGTESTRNAICDAMKRKYSLSFVITLMLIASALTCLVFAVFSGSMFDVSRKNRAAVREYATLLGKIEEMYIGEYDADDLSIAAMRASVYALGDRWSYYMTEQEYLEYINSMNNQFAGIGIGVAVDEETGMMKVLYTYRGSPAETAGILAGDFITEIDGVDLTGFTIDDMRKLLARPIGDTAEVKLLRSEGVVLTLEVVYDLVFSDPISYEMLEMDIGYVSISNFEGGSAEGFISAVNTLIEEGARAFVFDVRNNGGGRVSEMTRILDFLLPEGEIFISVGRDGKEEITISDADMVDMPAIVLVDRYSFSAAEYFAATLQEYDYAQIVGEQTTGKSRSQRTETLPNGGALHISTSQYLTKNRVALFDVGGLVPDHPLVLSDGDFSLHISGNLEKTADPQLQLALGLIK